MEYGNIFWPTAFGAAIGVVAGVFIQYLFQTLTDQLTRRKVRRSILKECKFNLLVINDIDGDLRRFRNAINGDSPHNALTFIPCVKGLHIQVNSLVATGRLYDFFSNDMLKRIQSVTQFLSPQTGQWYFEKLESHKQALMAGSGTKPDTISFLDFADQQVAQVREDLMGLLKDFGRPPK